ncbi:hypothetical protein C8R47DRAFT_99035 [Mycena vitilis]|nr:hypothetical protein C8R47DRAFT_99035 [Mycena vitilis]
MKGSTPSRGIIQYLLLLFPLSKLHRSFWGQGSRYKLHPDLMVATVTRVDRSRIGLNKPTPVCFDSSGILIGFYSCTSWHSRGHNPVETRRPSASVEYPSPSHLRKQNPEVMRGGGFDSLRRPKKSSSLYFFPRSVTEMSATGYRSTGEPIQPRLCLGSTNNRDCKTYFVRKEPYWCPYKDVSPRAHSPRKSLISVNFCQLKRCRFHSLRRHAAINCTVAESHVSPLTNNFPNPAKRYAWF